MTEARLATGIWVSALRQRLDAAAVPFYILARGDATAGAVVLIAAPGSGQAALWQREYDFDADARIWREVQRGTEAEITDAARRQRGFDPDLWLIEVERADLAPLLAEMG